MNPSSDNNPSRLQDRKFFLGADKMKSVKDVFESSVWYTSKTSTPNQGSELRGKIWCKKSAAVQTQNKVTKKFQFVPYSDTTS